MCLLYFSRRSWETENSSPIGSNYVFGHGTGLLTAAAVSCCSSLEQFLPVALETVLISFRVGLLAADTRDQIANKADIGSWRVRVDTCKPDVVLSQLEDLCAQKVLSSNDSAIIR